ncbi:tyrosine protein kinase, putative [Entamoeba dispar SAW760]|uniref:Tyrosine protein kinase, putative n=1 Tax=Entamoeba dispar (strain ATCC PRA-260 / SAW760) TaxID=370354 RepID=B0ELZ1_ENTDS|nr:tyrosine protein kinase, putative [Entamoeba dispar SAW760]EDR24447.1 tyrosine protein kinase, putative [Entamoeba dispar SAW760]|eukprot:EDR24447.1 tyrosine protein kinase, putative [Entamoeba dispar SAW760]
MFKRLLGSNKQPKEVGDILVSSADIQKGDLISKNGPHGDVYRCLFKKTKAVVKFFSKADSSQKSFKEETETLKKIFHPNVLLIMGIIAEKGITGVIMESMRCNLYNVLYEPTKCPKALQKISRLNKFKILRDIAVGLAFIHSLAKIPHGNLKLTNILFDDSGKVKISDYFYSNLRTPVKVNGYYVCSQKGNNAYQAPEVWLNGTFPNAASDVYSFALITIEFMVENNSFYGDYDTADDKSIFTAIQKKVKVTIPQSFSQTHKVILGRCLNYEPKNRPLMESVLAAFDQIVVESTMTSVDAIEFWSDRFSDGDVPLFEVSYDDVMFALDETVLSDCDENVKNEIKEDLAPLFPANGIVTAVDFDTVVCWFGEFFNDPKIIDEMRDIVSASYFSGLIDKKVAEGKLSGKVDGTYLIRMSFTDAKKNPFTLTRNVNGSPKHHRIERLSYAFVQARYQITIDNKKITAQTLSGLIEALTKMGLIVNPDDGVENSDYGEA